MTQGNHDLSLDSNYSLKHKEGWAVEAEKLEQCKKLLSDSTSITYLQHSSTVISLPAKGARFRVFGSPYSRHHSRQNWAFQYPDAEATHLWAAIPADIDVLITHTPPFGHCDASEHWRDGGCQALTEALWRVRPLLHVCGHCHEGRGAEVACWASAPGSTQDVKAWEDPGTGNKKQSLLDLTGVRSGKALDACHETVIVNCSIMAKSHGRGGKLFNKPIVVDICLPIWREEQASVIATAASTV